MIVHATLADYKAHIRQVAAAWESPDGRAAALAAWRELDELARHLVAIERVIIRLERGTQ
jgi:hypothetical protein